MACPLCRKKENFRVVMGKVKHTIFINVMNPFHICDVDRLTFRVSWPGVKTFDGFSRNLSLSFVKFVMVL